MWHFSAWYMKDPQCVAFIDQELRNYSRENSGSVASPMTLWAAGKPSLRGIIKGYVRRQEAQQAQWTTVLESSIADLDLWDLWSDGGELERQLALLRAKFRQASLAEARQCWQASTQTVAYYGHSFHSRLIHLFGINLGVRVIMHATLGLVWGVLFPVETQDPKKKPYGLCGSPGAMKN
ncbi:hypothetical protein NDU88_004891 [Pleurodeles waltl]|uniref:Uncharacterized protein n=1 Tax=Pleurodeles waltl TaxID=8319 RepID=A0AAV7UIB1_PLEWA|nr:hypothetical protein NDU88_004891 [Pleurodeles waltl]